ncbi:unnamed protein product [Closterium sp. NIES-54]
MRHTEDYTCGFTPSTNDPSLFLRTDTSLPPFYVLVYVDDLVFAADTEALTLVKTELQKRYTCTDLGELRSYLGLQITRDIARCTITLTQSHMVHQVLQRFDFQFSSPQPTPLSTGHSLSAPPLDESVEPSASQNAAIHPQNMEQTAPFFNVFICVLLLSMGAASAALLQSSSPPSLAPLAVSLRRKTVPVVKGKVFEVHTVRFHPTRSNGKVVGDRGASGKLWLKGVNAYLFSPFWLAGPPKQPSTSCIRCVWTISDRGGLFL